MIVNGVGHFVRFALSAGVKAADDSLQLREFAHHFGGEVALGELGGAVSFRDVGLGHAEVEPLLGEPAGGGADALDLVAVAAQAGFVRNALKFREIVGEPTFLVRLPEELRVGKTRAEHALVPRTDQSLGVLVCIDHGQEVRRKLAAFLFHGEVFLVVAHDGDENFVGQAQERWIEGALNNARVFVEVGHQFS